MLLFFIILSTECSGIKLPLRVYGGNDVSPGEYPYVVRIEVQHSVNFTNNTMVAKHDHLCTASALSSTWALTAAHCLDDLTYNYVGVPYEVVKLIIRYGYVNNSPWQNDSFSDILSVITHPLYTFTFDGYNHNAVMKNDIGLLKTMPMNIGSYMKLSAVDFFSVYGHEAVFAGFGITNKKLPDGKVLTEDTLLLKKPLQVLKILITKCVNNVPLVPSLCIAARCGHTVMTCGGDSGGPLIHPSGIVGLLSIGDVTGYCLSKPKKTSLDVAGVITPISPYIEWIYSYVTA